VVKKEKWYSYLPKELLKSCNIDSLLLISFWKAVNVLLLLSSFFFKQFYLFGTKHSPIKIEPSKEFFFLLLYWKCLLNFWLWSISIDCSERQEATKKLLPWTCHIFKINFLLRKLFFFVYGLLHFILFSILSAEQLHEVPFNISKYKYLNTQIFFIHIYIYFSLSSFDNVE
jgi:hypothetical protein